MIPTARVHLLTRTTFFILCGAVRGFQLHPPNDHFLKWGFREQRNPLIDPHFPPSCGVREQWIIPASHPPSRMRHSPIVASTQVYF